MGDKFYMKKAHVCSFIILLGLVFFAGQSFAETTYVTGVTKITMRTGPGVSHKVVAMLTTGTPLEIVEYQKDWSQVKTDRGKTGWVLTRFLTQKIPDAVLNEKLETDNLKLLSQLDALEKENKTLKQRLEKENKTLKQTNERLVQLEKKYHTLKQSSAEFLKLDAEHKKVVQQNEAQKVQIEKLEEDLDSEPKLWFLIGPGVFIVGLFFGLSTRKKKNSGLL